MQTSTIRTLQGLTLLKPSNPTQRASLLGRATILVINVGTDLDVKIWVRRFYDVIMLMSIM